MNNAKTALTASMAVAKDMATPENIRAGLVAAAEKGKELAQGAPAVANQVSDSPNASQSYLINRR